MRKSIELKLKLNDPQTNWILDGIFEALEDDEEILVFETTHTDTHITVYVQLRCYHDLEWIVALVKDQLEQGEQLLEYK